MAWVDEGKLAFDEKHETPREHIGRDRREITTDVESASSKLEENGPPYALACVRRWFRTTLIQIPVSGETTDQELFKSLRQELERRSTLIGGMRPLSRVVWAKVGNIRGTIGAHQVTKPINI
jgi:hypothetical protein